MGARTQLVRVPVPGALIEAEVTVPERPVGVVVVAPASGGARRVPHLRATAARLVEEGWATVLVGLLTPREEQLGEVAVQRALDVGMLSGRIAGVLDWVHDQGPSVGLPSDRPVGLLGAGRGAAAVLLTAARRPAAVGAVVSRGLRVGLGPDTLSRVVAPTLLITADRGTTAPEVARRTADRLGGDHELRVVEDADAPFLAPRPLDEVLDLTCDWFARHLPDAA